MSNGGNLTEVLRHPAGIAEVCVTGALQPRGLMHGVLGESTAPAGSEIISIQALSAVSVRTVTIIMIHSSHTDH